ncbi:peroxiredoxin [Candidatus Woesearchaeota archaeon]|nr:peroxiredoxin [Candidatus Woesearchaeota archaeon]
MTLPIGSPAPDFEARDQNNKVVRLSDFRGRHVILYFYPKDNTPGCTVEAVGFQHEMNAFKKHKVVVLGVSTDSVASHCGFAKKHKLSFQLLSDEDKKMSKAYDVLGLLGRVIGLAKRVTYVIDKEGLIEEVFTSVSPAEHAKDLALIFSRRK